MQFLDTEQQLNGGGRVFDLLRIGYAVLKTGGMVLAWAAASSALVLVAAALSNVVSDDFRWRFLNFKPQTQKTIFRHKKREGAEAPSLGLNSFIAALVVYNAHSRMSARPATS